MRTHDLWNSCAWSIYTCQLAVNEWESAANERTVPLPWALVGYSSVGTSRSSPCRDSGPAQAAVDVQGCRGDLQRCPRENAESSRGREGDKRVRVDLRAGKSIGGNGVCPSVGTPYAS